MLPGADEVKQLEKIMEGSELVLFVFNALFTCSNITATIQLLFQSHWLDYFSAASRWVMRNPSAPFSYL